MAAKVSVGSSAFMFGVYESNPVPFEKLLARVQELGFQGLELVGMKPYGDPDDIASRGDRKKFLRRFTERGLSISNYGADFKGKSPASGDPAVRSEYMGLFDKNLGFCADCGIPSMRVDTVNEPPLAPGVSYGDAWKRFAETWRSCAAKAEREGVRVVWEFEPGFMFNKPGEVLRMLQDVGHRNFKVLFDSCHAHMCACVGARQTPPLDTLPGGEIEFAERLAGGIGYVHLIDSDDTLHGGWTSTHAPFGTGFVKFDGLLEAIKACGYSDDWWTIDLCFWPGAWELLEDSKKFMDGLLKRHGLR
jgi:sugar phosphate isomerase/epimerase